MTDARAAFTQAYRIRRTVTTMVTCIIAIMVPFGLLMPPALFTALAIIALIGSIMLPSLFETERQAEMAILYHDHITPKRTSP